MNPEKIRQVLQQIQDGSLSIEKAEETLKHLPYEDIGIATIDHHRALRRGVPEVIFCQNKTAHDTIEIIKHMRGQDIPVLATRVNEDTMQEIVNAFPEGKVYERAHAFTIGEPSADAGVGNVLVVSAGTSDLPVAEEAVLTARFTGSKAKPVNDVGVAGIHRLFGRLEEIRAAHCIVVVAGMEGALPSVISGLVDIPVIAVPTSVGYGAHFGGLAALLTMLNSCSAGITVVNIDNGFGAGYAASQINKRICEAGSDSNK